MQEIMLRFTSRKFLIAVFAMVLVIFHKQIGIDADTLKYIVITAFSYIGGESINDYAKTQGNTNTDSIDGE